MSILPIVAFELANNEHLNGKWPTVMDEDGDLVVASRVRQYGNYTLVFDEPVYPYVAYRSGKLEYTEEVEDVEGLPYLGNYGGEDGEEITREQYEEYVRMTVGGDHSKLEAYFEKKVQANAVKMADLNKQVGVLVNEIALLAREAGLPFNVDLGDYGTLDVDGPWNSSSAYC